MPLQTPPPQEQSERPSRIVFGSCNSQHYPQVLWPHIRSRDATAFVWAGDAIYADKVQAESEEPKYIFDKPKGIPGTPSIIKQLYEEQLAEKEYSQLIKEVDIFGTFDDHDYGIDNGDKTYPFKRESAIEYTETFLQLPQDSIMAQRARDGAGVYGVRLYDFSREKGHELLSDDEAGIDPITERLESVSYSNRSVAVFVLDVRSNKTPWIHKGLQKFFDNHEGDFLGETQWIWLQDALSRSKASVNIIVNGLQVHANKYADPNLVEAWSRFPKAQHRLYQLLLQPNVRTPILISGDVHHASLSRKDCKSGVETRPLLELTTSGMTHSWGVYFCPSPRAGCQSWYTLFTARSIIKISHFLNPWTEILVQKGEEGAKSGLQYTIELNFGELEFDWKNGLIQARVLGVEKTPPLLSVRWDMDQQSLLNATNSWSCVNHRGHVNPIHHAASQAISIGILLCFAGAPTALSLLVVVFIIRRFRGFGISGLRE